MCNLYELEVAGQTNIFGKNFKDLKGNLPPQEVYPGGQGIVMKSDGELKVMTWGFPLKQLSKKTGKPIKPKAVNNARTDKLMTPYWKGAFQNPAQRCLIPVSAFAEAAGEPGKKTRTWLSVKDEPIFACAGIWRRSDEWGDVYSMVMTDARDDLKDVHDRMPVILKADDYEQWLTDEASSALSLCVPFGGEMRVQPTDELWIRSRN